MIVEKTLTIADESELRSLAQRLGERLTGGEIIELIGDVGAGKTTFTKGLALGLNITEPIQSPTFTISRIYQTPHDLTLAHYDFYRLSEAGVMENELHEMLHHPTTVTVVEWADVVRGVLPPERLQLQILPGKTETTRRCTFTTRTPNWTRLIEELLA